MTPSPTCRPSLLRANQALKKTKTKTKMSLKESAAYLASSAYIRNLAALVICYGMSINIVEVSPTYVAAGCVPYSYTLVAMLYFSCGLYPTLLTLARRTAMYVYFTYIANPLCSPPCITYAYAYIYLLCRFHGRPS